jgi:hypothetical protein
MILIYRREPLTWWKEWWKRIYPPSDHSGAKPEMLFSGY